MLHEIISFISIVVSLLVGYWWGWKDAMHRLGAAHPGQGQQAAEPC